MAPRLSAIPNAKIIWAGLVLFTAVAALFLPGVPQQLAAFALIALLPALSWGLPWRGSFGERLLIGAGLALALNGLATLLWQYLPGVNPGWTQAVLYTAVTLLPLLLPTPKIAPISFATSWPWLFVALFATLLRLPNMGYKEIQGDEGIVLFRAAAALMGDPQAILLHQKGPLEMMTVMSSWGLTGHTADYWVRLPFTWASILSVLAVGLLARRWFGERVGLLTAVFMSVMGFSIAFARILQYQSLVMLWGALALLAATRYVQECEREEDERAGWLGNGLVLAGLFTAVGLLAHYDAVLVVPAVAWLLLGAAWFTRRFNWRQWLAGFLTGLLALALFYLPYMMHPNFARTFRYLFNDRVGTAEDGSLAGGNLTAVWQMFTLYNSTFFIVGLAILLLVGGIGLLWRRRTRQNDWLTLGTAVLYFLTPALFYTLVVTEPRTHVYTIFPGALVLAAMGVDWLWQGWPLAQKWRPFTAVVLVGWVALSAHFVFLMFVDVSVERQRHFPDEWPALHPITWEKLPEHGLFGFPYQAGWRLAGNQLADAPGWYASNEEELITDWYMAQAPRTHCANAERVLLAENVQDEYPVPPEALVGKQNTAVVTLQNRPNLRLFDGRQQVLQTVRGDTAVRWLTPAQVAPRQDSGTFPVGQDFGGLLRLRGYDLDDSQAHPGGRLVVTLYWEALAPIDQQYQTYVHLYDVSAGLVRGAHDGSPECGANPTSAWQVGQVVPDPHIIPIAPDTAVGDSLSVLTGAYDLLTVAPLPRTDGSPDGTIDALYLRDVILQQK